MKGRIFITLLLIIVTGCKNDQVSLHNLDIEKAFQGSTEFQIEDYCNDISYVKLETSNDFLLGNIYNIARNEDYIFIHDDEDNLFQYTIEGEFLRKIGTQGRGPGEYAFITDFVLDNAAKHIYICDLGKLLKYDLNGEFIEAIMLDEGNLQVLCMDESDRFYFILPDKRMPQLTTKSELIKIFTTDGDLLKIIETDQVRHEGFAFFNDIFYYDNYVYYKEELGDYLYRINSNLEVDSIFRFNFGKYKFTPDDFIWTQEKSLEWEKKFRLGNLVIQPNKLLVFNFQRGLKGRDFEPMVWDYRKNTLIYPHRSNYPKEKGIFLDDIKITPLSTFKDQMICVIPIDQIILKEDIENTKIKDLSKNMDESLNPIVVFLNLK